MISFLIIIFILSISANAGDNFRIRFKISMQQEKLQIYNMFKCDDHAGIESRAQLMRVPLKLARKIHGSDNFNEVEDDIEKFIVPEYKKLTKEMEAELKKRESFWNANIREFSALVKELTGTEWFYPYYDYYVTAFRMGVSDWHENIVGVRYDLKDDMERHLFAYEIIEAQARLIMRKYFSEAKINNDKLWAFSEVTAALIIEDHRFDRFWPDKVHNGNYFSQSNYPQLASLEDDLRSIYLKRKDFTDYVNKAVPVLQNFKDTHNIGNKMPLIGLKYDFTKDNNEWNIIKPLFEDGNDNLKIPEADIRNIYAEIYKDKLYILLTTEKSNYSNNSVSYLVLIDIDKDRKADFQLGYNTKKAWLWDLRNSGYESYKDFKNLTDNILHRSYFGKTIKFVVPVKMFDKFKTLGISVYTMDDVLLNPSKKWIYVKKP